MYDAIAVNRRNTFFLIAVMIAVLMVVGYALGLSWGLGEGGLIIAALVALLWIGISYFHGDSITLSASRAREIQKADRGHRRGDHSDLRSLLALLALERG